ncbi:hypothetical protein J6590_015612 [Homalodisca vitripennis]|nr:hypothetical protein J6590_015612 [Homalodisca vitripennis]
MSELKQCDPWTQAPQHGNHITRNFGKGRNLACCDLQSGHSQWLCLENKYRKRSPSARSEAGLVSLTDCGGLLVRVLTGGGGLLGGPPLTPAPPRVGPRLGEAVSFVVQAVGCIVLRVLQPCYQSFILIPKLSSH